jgi:hypothetical protein
VLESGLAERSQKKMPRSRFGKSKSEGSTVILTSASLSIADALHLAPHVKDTIGEPDLMASLVVPSALPTTVGLDNLMQEFLDYAADLLVCCSGRADLLSIVASK